MIYLNSDSHLIKVRIVDLESILKQSSADLIALNRLRVNLVNLFVECSQEEFALSVASQSYYHWLVFSHYSVLS